LLVSCLNNERVLLKDVTEPLQLGIRNHLAIIVLLIFKIHLLETLVNGLNDEGLVSHQRKDRLVLERSEDGADFHARRLFALLRIVFKALQLK